MRQARGEWLRGRPLSDNEREFLQTCFGDSLHDAPIRVASSIGHRSWSPYGHRISLVRTHFVRGSAREELRLDDPSTASCLAHEALHVWQRQHGRRVTWEAIPLQVGYTLGRFDPYSYDRTTDPVRMLEQFVQGNVEQQGKIFEDYVYTLRDGRETAAFEAVAHHVRASRAKPVR